MMPLLLPVETLGGQAMRDDIENLLGMMPDAELSKLNEDFGMELVVKLAERLPEQIVGLLSAARFFGVHFLPGILAYTDDRLIYGMSRSPDNFSPRWDIWEWSALNRVSFSEMPDGFVQAMVSCRDGERLTLRVGANVPVCAALAQGFLRDVSNAVERAQFN